MYWKECYSNLKDKSWELGHKVDLYKILQYIKNIFLNKISLGKRVIKEISTIIFNTIKRTGYPISSKFFIQSQVFPFYFSQENKYTFLAQYEKILLSKCWLQPYRLELLYLTRECSSTEHVLGLIFLLATLFPVNSSVRKK